MANAGQTHGKTSGTKVATTQSYVRDFIKLFPNSSNGEFTDIKNLINRIIFKENIRQGSVICEIDVLDGLNMLETFKLSGGEKVEIQISQDSPLEKHTLRRTFFVSDIINHVKPRPGYQTYQLICISEYAYLNNLIRLDRDFQGSPGKLIKNILSRDLQVDDNDINVVNTSSGSIMQGIYPRLKPLDAINWLNRNSFDENTPFYFYDTLHKGITFNSLKEMIAEESDIEYIHKPFFKIFKNEEEEFKDSRKRIRKLSSNLGMSKFNQAGKGSYSSSLTSIDIATKKVVEDFEYRYNDDFAIKDHKIENVKRKANKPFSTETKFLDKELNNFPQARRYNISLNSLAFDKKNYHDHVPTFIQKSEAIKNGFDYMSMELLLNGDFRLHCGKMASVIIPKSTSKGLTKSSKEVDEVLSGSYMVTNIIHEFNLDEYIMNVVMKKDSTLMNLEGAIDFNIGVTDKIE